MPDTSAMIDYARYRLERAKEDLDAARLLHANNSFRIANNRAYQSIFMMLLNVMCAIELPICSR